jgi:hypothetical protein
MFKHCAGAAALILVAATAATAAETTTSPTKGPACRELESKQEFYIGRCAGPNGYGVRLEEMDGILSVYFGPLGREKSLAGDDDLTWREAGDGLGSRIEWHMANGRPYAALLDTRRQTDDPDKPMKEILVAKVDQSGSCRMATVGARNADAVRVARKFADSFAEKFQCGRDKPFMQPDPSGESAACLDGRFGPREALDHNGSVIVLTRSGAGDIEIRYQTPRPGLPVRSGALLFRGQADQRGHLIGVAFTFKPGCEPAPYAVHGERSDGVLVLDGPAPRRGRTSCAIIGSSSDGGNARLVFRPEAVDDFQ